MLIRHIFKDVKSRIYAVRKRLGFSARLCSFLRTFAVCFVFPGIVLAQTAFIRNDNPAHPLAVGPVKVFLTEIPPKPAQFRIGDFPEREIAGADSPFLFEQGAIIRGDKTSKKLAVVFTGDEFSDGADVITRTLDLQGVKASFFLTGRFYRNRSYTSRIRKLKRKGHYLGAHSDEHLLYCDWKDRQKLLIGREQFERDLNNNYAAMRAFGIRKNEARFFLPPFEWYNRSISDWTAAMGLQLINFTPGTRSNADYTTPEMKNYASSQGILQRIREYEAEDPAGLNGFILLLHIGVAPERTDKFYDHLDELIVWLKTKQYKLVRIDQLLSP